MLRALLLLLLVSAATTGVEAVVRFQALNYWYGGFSGVLAVQVPTAADGWTVHVIFSLPVESLDAGSSVTASKVGDREFVLSSKTLGAPQQAGQTVNITLVGTSSGETKPNGCAYVNGLNDDVCTHIRRTSAKANTSLSGAPESLPAVPRALFSMTAPSVDINPPEHPSMGNKNYAEALRLSILFYYAQRSGELPDDNPIPWRRDSALGDCVVGGFYDAGDRVKFGFPLASAMTLLLWGVNRFKDGYATAGQLWDFYNIARWGLDFMMDSWNPFTQELVIQIGDGDLDHQFWGKSGNVTVPRPCVKISPDRPGSDVAGEYAAALAAGAIAFRDKGEIAYSNQLLETAESIYNFAERHRGLYTDSPPLTQSWYYRSTGDKDEMCVAGAWLFKATGDMDYLARAEKEHETSTAKELSWNDKRAACQLLLYEITGVDAYADEFEAFLKNWRPGGLVDYTPCGLAWSDRTYWGSNRHAANVAFAALLAAEDGLEPDGNRKWAAEQMNYILGDNPHDGGCFSYEIGYGNKYPLRPHHKAASCPAPPAQCTPDNLNTDEPSPHILYGGLVGGPLLNDGYNDTRTDYVHNEVALDYNAGFQSTLAALVQLVATGHLPQTNNKCQCPE